MSLRSSLFRATLLLPTRVRNREIEKQREGRGERGTEMRIYGVYESSSRSNVRAFLEYILPAGGSSAINITRSSNPPGRRVREGVETGRGRSGRESNSFRRESAVPDPPPFVSRDPFPAVPTRVPFFDLPSGISRIYVSVSTAARASSWRSRSIYFGGRENDREERERERAEGLK